MLETSSTVPEKFFNDAGEIIYPDSDGKPMADNTLQFEWITKIKGNLDFVFYPSKEVFVAGDLLWYPEKGKPQISVAPDIFVVLGRPKGYRGSYKQWEEGQIPPQVVFEILSPTNTALEMQRKWNFYTQYGVIEYYVYDPFSNDFFAYERQGDSFRQINFENSYTSPLLQIRFEKQALTMNIYSPQGYLFLSYEEICLKEQKERLDKEEERRLKEEERRLKEEEQKAKEEAIKEEQKAIAEKEEALIELARLKQKLKDAGLE